VERYLNKEEEQQITELRLHYRTCFSSSSGKVVLKHMLQEMMTFNDDIHEDDQEGRVLRNYANRLLERLGCADNPDSTIDALIGAILNLPIIGIKEE
jgi:hypothetical protein